MKLLLLFLLSSTIVAVDTNLRGVQASESELYVHNFIGVDGNWTYVEKPFFPVFLNSSQIEIGKNWSIVCSLVSGKSYHVYCYGSWVSSISSAKTDYDIYVLDPQGKLESEHTEAAGLPEHLGTTVNDALFVPIQSGNYTFVIMNDPKESKGAEQATFMVIENVECDTWLSHFSEGKIDSNFAGFNTCWAYEFVADDPYLELWINVPPELDMYEARLYLMNNENSPSINGFPLPWEMGLYGNRSSIVGGYNFDNVGYRGVAVASCEYRGQHMFLNYTALSPGRHLYHLVFIGEVGSGNIDYLIKTSFGEAVLTPQNVPKRVIPFNPVDLAFTANMTELDRASLTYSVDDWRSSTSVDMAINNKTCSATIPGQEAGIIVQYKISASDVLKNYFSVSGNFNVKQVLSLNISAISEKATLGENITILGFVTPGKAGLPVKLEFSRGNVTEQVTAFTFANGTFSVSNGLKLAGIWQVRAKILETNTAYECYSEYVELVVVEPPFYVVYSLFIMSGVAAAIGVFAAVYFLKLRNR